MTHEIEDKYTFSYNFIKYVITLSVLIIVPIEYFFQVEKELFEVVNFVSFNLFPHHLFGIPLELLISPPSLNCMMLTK